MALCPATGKQNHPTMEAAEMVAERVRGLTKDTTLQAYKCHWYSHFHIGHDRPRHRRRHITPRMRKKALNKLKKRLDMDTGD